MYSPLVDLCSSYTFVHPLCTSVRYMFWTDWGARPLIGRSALDGSGRIDLVTTRLKYINALAIDFDTDTLYWADAYTDVIETSDLNGRYACCPPSSHILFSLVHLFSLPPSFPPPVPLHSLNFYKMPISPHPLLTPPHGSNRTVFLSNLLHPYGMALYGSYLYWTDWTSHTIQRVNKTNGREQTSVVSEISYMNAIQVVNRDRQPG